MAELVKDADLQLFEDERSQRREWVVERVAWAVFAFVLLAAGLGALGGGPLSSGRASAGDLTVEYQRVSRRQRPVEVVVRLAEAASGQVTVALRGKYFEQAEIETVWPRPAQETALADGVRYTFEASAGALAAFSFTLTPEGAGRQSGEVQAQEEAVAFSTLIYP